MHTFLEYLYLPAPVYQSTSLPAYQPTSLPAYQSTRLSTYPPSQLTQLLGRVIIYKPQTQTPTTTTTPTASSSSSSASSAASPHGTTRHVLYPIHRTHRSLPDCVFSVARLLVVSQRVAVGSPAGLVRLSISVTDPPALRYCDIWGLVCPGLKCPAHLPHLACCCVPDTHKTRQAEKQVRRHTTLPCLALPYLALPRLATHPPACPWSTLALHLQLQLLPLSCLHCCQLPVACLSTSSAACLSVFPPPPSLQGRHRRQRRNPRLVRTATPSGTHYVRPGITRQGTGKPYAATVHGTRPRCLG